MPENAKPPAKLVDFYSCFSAYRGKQRALDLSTENATLAVAFFIRVPVRTEESEGLLDLNAENATLAVVSLDLNTENATLAVAFFIRVPVRTEQNVRLLMFENIEFTICTHIFIASLI